MKNNSTPNQSTRLSRVLAGLSMLAACVSLAFANPGSPTVVNGQATFNQTGNVLTITNTPNTIINWQNFNINAGEITRFLQQNSDSAVLNRILGQNPSQILGALQSNGRVFLINPNGIVFGQGAQINVNGLVASSLNLPDQDFLSGKRHFVGSPGNGKVSNQGNITTPGGGSVFLLAPSVENSGIINAPNGDVLLAAGHSIKLVDSSNPEVQVVVSAPQALAINLGQLVSQGGRIGIYGALVKQGGRINADSAVLGENGKIILKASGDTLLDNGSVTSANAAGKGGDISILGERVAMLGNASIQANGQTGGGTVLVGGDYQGKNAKVQNASRTIFDKDASISADALQNGNGGKVIVWANDRTNALGIITARGGNQGGNGGFVETSGKNTLDFHAKVNVSAPKGKNGTLLLDPANITIIGGTGDGNNDSDNTTFHGGTNPGGTVLFADPDLTTASVSNIFQSEIENLPGGTNIVLEATNSIKANGTFTGNALTLPMNSNLTMRTSNETTGSMPGIDLAHTSHLEHFDVIGRGTGSITLQTGTSMMSSGSIQIGKLQVDAGNVNVMARGLFDIGSSICTNTGNLDLTGHNITLASNGQLFSHTGNVNLNATAASGTINLGSSSTTTIDGSSTGKLIRLTADNLDIVGTVNSGPLGEVRISPNDLSRNIDIVATKAQTSLELTQSDLANVSGGFLSLHNNAFVHVNSGLDLSSVKNFSFFANNIDIQNNIGLSQTNSVMNVFAANQIGLSGSGGLSTNGSGSKIYLVGEAINLAGAPGSINAGSGSVYLGPDVNRTGTNIEVGLNATSVSHVLGISTASLATIHTTGKVQIGTPELGWAGHTTVLAGGLDLTASSLGGKVKLAGGQGTGNVTLNGMVRVPNGIEVESQKALIINGGGGIEANGISLAANEMHLDGGADSIKGSNASINVLPHSAGQDINLGTASDSIANTLGLSSAELLSFHGTGVLRIGEVAKNNNIEISADIAPAYAGKLSLAAGGTISQTGTITTANLALRSAMGVDLSAANHINSLAAEVGDNVSNQDKNFKFVNAQSLNIADHLDGLNGIKIFSSMSNYDSANPNSVIALGANGNLTQTTEGLLASKALYVQAGNVVLNQANPVGVIAGKWNGNSAGDGFKFTSINGIALSSVSSHSGITYLGTATPGVIDLTAGPGGIQQSAGASVSSGGALSLATTGPVNFADGSNNVSALSSQGSGVFFFKNSTDLQIGVGELGISSANQSIAIDVPSGSITIGKNINAGSGDVQMSAKNIDLHDAVALTGNMIHLRATDAATGKISTSGSSSANVGSSASSSVIFEADVIDFHANGPNVTATAGDGVIRLGNHSDDFAMTINANYGANYVSNVVAFGNGNIVDGNTTSAITLATPITAPGQTIAFFTSGNLTQTAPVVAQGLAVKAGSAVLNQANQVHKVAASITGTGAAYTLTNSGALVVGEFPGSPGSLAGITTNNGPITIDNTGAVVINNPVNSGSGAISIVAHSPLTVNSSVTTTGGNILLEAGSSGSTSDILLISSTGSVGAASGQITLRAGSAIIEQTPVQGTVIRQPNQNPVLLPTLAQCIANPALPDCNQVLPTLSSCISNPTAQGCSVVLPNLTACIATPTLPGCSVVLPNITACIATPTLPGCSVTLPNITACIATPTLPGCSVVLPNITACIATPTLPGCSVTLPNLTACIATPTLPGCSVVLPNITACIATPTLPGCSVTLPNLTACIATPTLPGCQVVLPNITACIATPTLPGCSVTLPNITACIAEPTLPGCSVILPNITACIATPTLPGCSVTLPNITACIATPTLPGCQVVLPNITACIATPTLPGCNVTLPNLTACIATPTLPGCQVVLPNITACIATPTLPGCSVTLPNLSACIATPSLPGCQVVLPNLTACIATPTLPGCSVTLPNLTACIATPTLPGCQVVLPNLTACIATPTLPGCSAVLPTLAQCTSNASLPGCAIILPPTQQTAEQPLQQALNESVNVINKLTSKPEVSTPSPIKTTQPGPAEPTTLAQVDSKVADKTPDAKAPDNKTDVKPGEKSAEDAKKDEKKDDKKDDKLVASKDAPKKEEPVRKLYCN